MGELGALIAEIWETTVNYFGAFGEPDTWVKHFLIYFCAGLVNWWIFSFAAVCILKFFRQVRPEVAVWTAAAIGLAIVGLLTAGMALGIAFFAKQQGSSPVYALGYGVFVAVCFLGIYLFTEKVEESCVELEKMLRSGIEF